jgi:subtilisin family serine protease
MPARPPRSSPAILAGAFLLLTLFPQCRPSETADQAPPTEPPSGSTNPPDVRDLPRPAPPLPYFFIAIIDSGIDAAHPLFTGAFAPTESLRAHLPPDLADRAEPIFSGWDLVEDTPHPVDHTGHGTHVAGILARELGLPPEDSPVRLLVLRTGNKIHPLEHLTKAVNLLADCKKTGLPVPLVVLPLEYYLDPQEASAFAEFESALQSLLADDTLAVCAAGNKGQDNDAPSGETHCYPSDFPFPNLLSVACCNDAGHLHPLSNFGSISVDLAAPGFGIDSATLDGGCQTITGSSQACAYVAARAAELWLTDRTQSVETVRRAILALSVVHPSLIHRTATNGYLPRLAPDPPAEAPAPLTPSDTGSPGSPRRSSP